MIYSKETGTLSCIVRRFILPVLFLFCTVCCGVPRVNATSPTLTVEKYYFRASPIQYATNRLYIIVTASEDYVGYITISYLHQGVETILIQKQWVSIIANDHAGLFSDVSFSNAGEVELKASVVGVDNSIPQVRNGQSTVTIAPDSDKDGIPNQLDTDNDNDGLSDSEEVSRGTNPFVRDTDGDGLSDLNDPFPNNSQENNDVDRDGIGDNADSDDDNDGLSDADEQALGTDPLKADSDNDGVPDATEVLWGTDPKKSDTDGDGASDLTDPQPKDPTKSRDTDGDKVADEDEIAFGLDPKNPDDATKDPDGDGIVSGEEIRLYRTNPLKADSDNDSLRDDFEVTYSLDPNDQADARRDNDTDGVSNRFEALLRTNPQQSRTYGVPDVLILPIGICSVGGILFFLFKRKSRKKQ